MVATPIGNLDDISTRAQNVLQNVQIIAAEDTRRTTRLLAHLDVKPPKIVSLHEHNELRVAPRLIQALVAGNSVALVSDAGTPLLNDPGFPLLKLAYEHHVAVVPVPGASSITALLSVCPLPCQPFRYIGFLPSKAQARLRVLNDCLGRAEATVFLESPHRIAHTLQALASLSERALCIGRELTKQYETVMVGSAEEILAQGLAERGEFTVVMAAMPESGNSGSVDARKLMQILCAELAPSQAARLGAAICGEKKSKLYELALSIGDAAG